jgi:AcrR family transcriptional regulator
MAASPRQRREPLQARSRETVERVLAAAAELIVEQGVDAATTTAIAARAGVGPSSLYRFFSDRDALFALLLEAEVKEIERVAQAGEDAWEVRSVRDYVQRMLEMFLGYHERRPLFVRLWFGGRVSPAVTAIARAGNVALAERARERLVAAGLVSEDSPKEVALLAVEVGDRILELAFRGRRRADRRVIAEGAEMLIAYLEASAGPSRAPSVASQALSSQSPAAGTASPRTTPSRFSLEPRVPRVPKK